PDRTPGDRHGTLGTLRVANAGKPAVDGGAVLDPQRAAAGKAGVERAADVPEGAGAGHGDRARRPGLGRDQAVACAAIDRLAAVGDGQAAFARIADAKRAGVVPARTGAGYEHRAARRGVQADGGGLAVQHPATADGDATRADSADEEVACHRPRRARAE